MNNGDEDPE